MTSIKPPGKPPGKPSNNSGPTPEFRQELVAKLKKHVLRGDYQGGLRIAREALGRYPEDLTCRYQYAKLLGDWADELTPARKARYKKEAIAILRPLTRRLSGRDPEESFGLCLNYYYQSQDFTGMVAFGRRQAGRGVRKGHYAEALGACLHAQKLEEAGKPARAGRWARISVAAWKRYDLRREPYYFAHYSLALALALAGQRSEARRTLAKAARLSGRPVTDWEFADVLKLLA